MHAVIKDFLKNVLLLDSKRAEDNACRMEHATIWLENCDKNGVVYRIEGVDPAKLIVETAGRETVIVLGASLRHDVYRRMLVSPPMQILTQTNASVLLIKLPPEADSDFFKDPFSC